jgi:hypothetical protein
MHGVCTKLHDFQPKKQHDIDIYYCVFSTGTAVAIIYTLIYRQEYIPNFMEQKRPPHFARHFELNKIKWSHFCQFG